jgi:primosomal replication protein N
MISGVLINSFTLYATITQFSGMRYTPVGIPVLALVLEHVSELEDAGQRRTVNATVKTVAFGTVAESLVGKALGSNGRFKGFLSNSRKSLLFHVQEFECI